MPVLSSLRSTTFWGVSRRQLSGVSVPEVPALFAFTAHTFTTGGNVGRFGPSLGTLQSVYSSQAWASNSSYFTQGRAQGYQVWQVPATGIYEIEIAGARGQNSNSNFGYGLGAIVRARVSLSVTDRLEMVVGQVPGNGGSTNPNNSYSGSGGGSFVGLAGTNTPVLVAGGGAGLYGSWTTVQAIHNGQTRRQPRFTGYNYSPAADGVDPVDGGGGRGFHGGGGGGWFTAGQDYSGNAGSSSMTTGTGGQNFTHGASFVGSSVSNGGGTWFAIGGNATALTSEGGFGGGGGGHSGNNSSGGGGGYSGGNGGQTSLGGSFLSGIGGGSFIREGATNVATSNGQYEGSSTFGGNSITNIGSFNDGSGYITITRITGGGGGGGGGGGVSLSTITAITGTSASAFSYAALPGAPRTLLNYLQSFGINGNSSNDASSSWTNSFATLNYAANPITNNNYFTQFNRVRVIDGDGSADGPDWAVFNFGTANSFGDFDGSAASNAHFGGESSASGGQGGVGATQGYIWGFNSSSGWILLYVIPLGADGGTYNHANGSWFDTGGTLVTSGFGKRSAYNNTVITHVGFSVV